MKMVIATLLLAAAFAQAQDRSNQVNGCMHESFLAGSAAAQSLGLASVRSANRHMTAPIQVENGSEFIYTMHAYNEQNQKANGTIIVTMFRSLSGECSVADVKTELLNKN